MSDEQTEAFLAHVGVKGMKWGVRNSDTRSERPTKSERSARNKKIAKVAAATAVVAGAGAAAYFLKKHGNTKLAEVAASTAKKAVEAKVTAAAKPAAKPAATLSPSAPSPQRLLLEAGMRAQQQTMRRVGDQQLTRDLWENSVRVNQQSRQNEQDFQDSLSRLSRLSA